MSYAKTKKRKKMTKKLPANTANAPSVVNHQTMVIQTMRGPVVGCVLKETSSIIEVYAPAFVQMTAPTKVVFLPVGFCESTIVFQKTGIMGTNSIPEALLAGYAEFLKNFKEGAYRLTIVDAKMEGEATSIETNPVPSTELVEPAH
jgi:hypothetical protein